MAWCDCYDTIIADRLLRVIIIRWLGEEKLYCYNVERDGICTTKKALGISFTYCSYNVLRNKSSDLSQLSTFLQEIIASVGGGSAALNVWFSTVFGLNINTFRHFVQYILHFKIK